MTDVLLVVAALMVMNVAFAGIVVALRIRNNVRARRFGRVEERWEPVILRAIGGEYDAAVVPARDVRHVLEIAGRFARRLRGPDRERVQDFCGPLIDHLLPSLSARSPETRASAVELVGVLALNSQGEKIIAALGDRETRVSLVAAQALCQPGFSQHTDAVLDHLHRYSNRSPSLTSTMLARFGPEALEDLRRYLGDESRPTGARAVVATALRHLRDPRGAEIAAQALTSDSPDLVVSCLRLIGEVGGMAQAGRVRAVLSHPAFFVRAEAVTALSHFGDSSDVAPIARMVHDDSAWVAIRSARALLEMGQQALLEELSNGGDLAASSAREALDREAV